MNKKLTTKISIVLLALGAAFTSCQDDHENNVSYLPTALVTVKPVSNDLFVLQLDDSTRLEPSNMTFETPSLYALDRNFLPVHLVNKSDLFYESSKIEKCYLNVLNPCIFSRFSTKRFVFFDISSSQTALHGGLTRRLFQ